MILPKSLKSVIKVGLFLNCAVLVNGCGPGPVEKALVDGAAFEQRGQFAEAMVEYNRALEFAPNNTDAYYNRALLYQRQGNSEAALSDFNKIIEIHPNYSEPYYGRGTIYEGRGQRDKAIAEYTKALENNVNYTLAYYKRAMAYQYKGEYRKALDDAKKAKGLGALLSDDFIKDLEEEAARQR